ncbi:hypothetical protein E5288_WYG006666 [Bos mutus]|uniref:Uncharacterized protein n=1 Tax=Bos mutus TaxID=72004 RepID=A0A6B0RE40_9CETA|nr:hypothetical protein [Bos mutus]
MAVLRNGNTFRFLNIHAELSPIAKDPEQHCNVDVSESASPDIGFWPSPILQIHSDSLGLTPDPIPLLIPASGYLIVILGNVNRVTKWLLGENNKLIRVLTNPPAVSSCLFSGTALLVLALGEDIVRIVNMATDWIWESNAKRRSYSLQGSSSPKKQSPQGTPVLERGALECIREDFVTFYGCHDYFSPTIS